jgi:predicted AAA+ superfamily ATPase
VLDEIQRRPDLFPVIRVLVDRPGSRTSFLVLGSASPDLLQQSSETLAGRIAYHELPGFTMDELGPGSFQSLWLRGGFPRSFLAPTEEASLDWRREFIRTFLERDLVQLGFRTPSATLHRFWRMLAHYHAQTLNSAELARSLGSGESSVRRYLDALTSAFAVFQLRPWHENLRKREVKSPRIYVEDPGILHALLGVESMHELTGHPKVGASWEGFVIRQIAHHLGARSGELHFWALHSGAELDLLVVRGVRRRAFEIKRTTTPSVTRSMRSAIENLGLDGLDVIHAGTETFPLGEQIRAVSMSRILTDIAPW